MEYVKHNSFFSRTHYFDTQLRRTKKPKGKSGIISDLDKPSKGAEGCRLYHKLNEEKCLAHRRRGLPDDIIDQWVVDVKSKL